MSFDVLPRPPSCLVLSYLSIICCHVMSCHVMSCHVMSCIILTYLDIICCHVMSCHVMSCYVMSCPDMSWIILSYRGTTSTTDMSFYVEPCPQVLFFFLGSIFCHAMSYPVTCCVVLSSFLSLLPWPVLSRHRTVCFHVISFPYQSFSFLHCPVLSYRGITSSVVMSYHVLSFLSVPLSVSAVLFDFHKTF